MTNANTYLGQQIASPASLVGHHGSIIYRTAVGVVGGLLRLLNQILQFTLTPRRMSRLHVLAAFWGWGSIAHLCTVGALATPVVGGSPKTDFPSIYICLSPTRKRSHCCCDYVAVANASKGA